MHAHYATESFFAAAFFRLGLLMTLLNVIRVKFSYISGGICGVFVDRYSGGRWQQRHNIYCGVRRWVLGGRFLVFGFILFKKYSKVNILRWCSVSATYLRLSRHFRRILSPERVSFVACRSRLSMCSLVWSSSTSSSCDPWISSIAAVARQRL